MLSESAHAAGKGESQLGDTKRGEYSVIAEITYLDHNVYDSMNRAIFNRACPDFQQRIYSNF